MKNKKTICQRTGILIGLLLLMATNVLAFAVSSTYYPGYPLHVQAGETKNIEMTLQNLASTEDVQVKAQITSGSEIIQFTDPSDTYTIPAGEKTTVNMKVSVPEANAEELYPVTVVFTTLTTSEAGAFGLASSIGKSFDVIVGGASKKIPETEEKITTNWKFLLFVGILIITALVVLVLLINKARKKK